MMVTTVRGQFERFSGEVEFNPDTPASSSASVQIETDSLNTREAQRDTHLRSADFFEVETYPQICFQSTHIDVQDAHNAQMTGDLTIRGITRQITLDVTYNGQAKNPSGKTVAGFEVEGKLNRKDFGLEWNVAIEAGGVLVGDEVKILAEVELIRETEAAAA
jgi:polyisoprenoid-binding protein YceI